MWPEMLARLTLRIRGNECRFMYTSEMFYFRKLELRLMKLNQI